MNDDRTPNLLPVIQWLEAGCDPKHAAAELRIYAERLAALSAAPAQEPVAWRETALAFERRAMRVEYIIRMLVAAGHVAQEKVNEAFSIAKGFASPLPQEPQEMKALTDADAGLTAAWKVLHDETIPASNRYIRAIKAHREACGSSLREAKDAVDCLQSGRVRPPSWRELRGAQEGKAGEWSTVERDGMPPCDGETVFVGINSAGFACCFNQARPDGLCLMGSPECSTAQMSELRWWRVLDRPSASSKGEQR